MSTESMVTQGHAGDAIDFALGHCGPDEAFAFLDDWRADRANEWPGYVKWLSAQYRHRTAAQPEREAVLEDAVKQALLQVEKYAEFFCEEDFDPLVDQLRSCGKDLAEVLCETCGKWWADNPSPAPAVSQPEREAVLEEAKVATIVHEAMVDASKWSGGDPRPWQNGNSVAECRARDATRDILAALTTPASAVSTDEIVAALTKAREALHFHYVEWDGEPEDAVPLQLARSECDAILSRLRGEGE